MKTQTQRNHLPFAGFGSIVCVAVLVTWGAASVLMPSMASATTRLVPSQHGTIQAGIDAAQGGDTVLVAGGTYTGLGNRDLDFGGKNIVLLSESGAGATIVDCQQLGRGMIFQSFEDTTSVVDGFTFENGLQSFGGGIYIEWSSPKILNSVIAEDSANTGGGFYISNFCSPVIRDCIIRNNRAFSSGGFWIGVSSTPKIIDCTIADNHVTANSAGIGIVGSPLITGCTISGNKGTNQGGGINIQSSGSPTITNCVITGDSANSGGGILIQDTSTPTITGCTISGNEATFGGGIDVWENASPTITDCLIIGNYASSGGGGVSVWTSVTGPITLTSCTIAGNRSASAGGGVYTQGPSLTLARTVLWGNCAAFGDEAYTASSSDSLFFACSDVRSTGVSGAGVVMYDANTIFGDPLYCGAISCSAAPIVGGVYTLDDDSPCLATNSLCALLIGAKAQGCAGRSLDVVDGGFPSIQAAIDVAVGGVGDTVVVADSVWVGTGNTALDFNGKNLVLKSRNGPANTIIDGQGLARGIVFDKGEDSTAVVDGFTIIRGNPAVPGSAILIDSTSSPVIKNCLIKQNASASGVVFVGGGSPTFSFCTLETDTSSSALGIVTLAGGAPTIDNCVIQNNSALNAVRVATPTVITATQIIDNSGCGVYFDSTTSSNVGGSDISRNVDRGVVLNASSATFAGVVFRENGGGGAIVTGLGSPGPLARPSGGYASAAQTSTTNEFIDCEFSGHSTDRGAGFFFDCTNEPEGPYALTFINCRFTGNHATFEGGGVAICGRASNADIIPVFLNCTIAANNAQEGGGVYMGVTEIGIGRVARAEFDRTILWGNCSTASSQGEAYVLAGNEVAMGCSHTVVDDIAGSGLINATQVTTGIPAFCDYPASYYASDCQPDFTIAGDFALSPGSPAAPLNHPCGGQVGAFPVEPCVATAVAGAPDLPVQTVLNPPVPNPFNPVTTIEFTLATRSHVTLRIYDVKGRLVRTLADRPMPQAKHRLTWDGIDTRGSRVATGVYFLRFTSGSIVQTHKMVLLK